MGTFAVTNNTSHVIIIDYKEQSYELPLNDCISLNYDESDGDTEILIRDCFSSSVTEIEHGFVEKKRFYYTRNVFKFHVTKRVNLVTRVKIDDAIDIIINENIEDIKAVLFPSLVVTSFECNSKKCEFLFEDSGEKRTIRHILFWKFIVLSVIALAGLYVVLEEITYMYTEASATQGGSYLIVAILFTVAFIAYAYTSIAYFVNYGKMGSC